MHGGKSTGPKTAEGLERCRLARWKHGFYAREAGEARRQMRALVTECRELLARLRGA
jgi:hypothetical protein